MRLTTRRHSIRSVRKKWTYINMNLIWTWLAVTGTALQKLLAISCTSQETVRTPTSSQGFRTSRAWSWFICLSQDFFEVSPLNVCHTVCFNPFPRPPTRSSASFQLHGPCHPAHHLCNWEDPGSFKPSRCDLACSYEMQCTSLASVEFVSIWPRVSHQHAQESTQLIHT